MKWNEVKVIKAFSGTSKLGKPFHTATIRDGEQPDVSLFSEVTLEEFIGETVDLDVRLENYKGTLSVTIVAAHTA